jgi:hypothetical protein
MADACFDEGLKFDCFDDKQAETNNNKKTADQNNDGQIELDEFINWAARQNNMVCL